MSRFKPVHLPEERRLNGRASQTFLRHYDRCPRSAYLYQLYRGEASSPEMQRGSALHAVIEQSIQAAINADEKTIPPEIVKAIVNEVLADPQYAVPINDHDYVRESAFRWAAEFAVEPGAVVALETLFVWDVAGYQVRCKIDFAESVDAGAVVVVKDWKSSRALPGFEEVARKRPDGTLAAKHFQLVMYALVLAFGVPVRFEDGVEIPEPFGVAQRAQRFDTSFVFPGIEEKSTGKMASRPVTLTRLELEEYRASVEGLLARVAHSEATGEWDAVASDDACSECPAASLCPIPQEVRDHRGRVNTMEEAAEAAEVRYRRQQEDKAILKELKLFAKAHGEIRFGGDMTMRFDPPRETEKIADKDAMWAAIERAVQYGEEFNPADHMKRTSSTPFVTRKLTAAELEVQTEESEGSNGSADVERERDERYGADVPF